MLVFLAERDEPARVHPMQLWRTPFASEEHAAAQPAGQGFFGRIGNADLVRGIADLMAVGRALAEQVPTRAAYDDLIRQCTRVVDAHGWLDQSEAGGVHLTLHGIGDAARATLAEFEKVDSIRQQTQRALRQAEGEQRVLMTDIASTIWREPRDFMQALGRLRERRGQVQLLRELRYTEGSLLDSMDTELVTEQQRVGTRALQFLAAPKAFDGPRSAIEKIAAQLPQAQTSPALAEHLSALDDHASGLDLLTEQLGNLPGGDPVVRTAILDQVSTLYADINRLRADTRQRRKSLGAHEAAAEFGAQFKLFGQAVENAVEFADTPEKCDEALTRLLAQLEELEGRFAEHDQFLGDIAARRETVYEALASRRQTLLEARQRRAQAVGDAAARILDGIPRRVAALQEMAQVHGFFAADPLIAKLRSLTEDLRQLGAAVAADELDTRLKTARDQALRSVRDQRDLSSDDGNSLRLGRHRFTVNRQALDLSLVTKEGTPHFHISGSDYFIPVKDVRLEAHRPVWDQALVSESADLARAEYLAAQMLIATQAGRCEWSWAQLHAWAVAGDGAQTELLDAVRRFAAPRYAEGYQKGVHDVDAARLLQPLVRMHESAGLLSYGPAERALGLLYWQLGTLTEVKDALGRKARAALRMHSLFGDESALRNVQAELAPALRRFCGEFAPLLAVDDAALSSLSTRAAAYLPRQLAATHGGERWVISGAGADLAAALTRDLEKADSSGIWQHDLAAAAPAERWSLARSWVLAYAQAHAPEALAWVDDAASMLAVKVERDRHNLELDVEVSDLLSEHARIIERRMRLNLNDLWRRVMQHDAQVVPAFQALQTLRLELVRDEKARLHLTQFQAKPLSSFVRNKLINDVYLPLIGDNLAKQLGTVGENKRSDLMGLLMLISPPGYGKTTLMEYVAHRLGLVFVKINGPSLGHEVRSLDPARRPTPWRGRRSRRSTSAWDGQQRDAVSRRHPAHQPELLQKFISLCDGTRRIEGVWRGHPHLRPARQKFAVVMAGNPYTESGEPSGSRTCWPTAPTSTTSATCSAGRRHVRSATSRTPDLQRGACPAGHARPCRPLPAGRQGPRPRGLHQRAHPRLRRCGDQRDRPVLKRMLDPEAQGQPAVHRERGAGRQIPRRAAVQAAGQLPQHEQAGGESLAGDERCGRLRQVIADHYLGESQLLTQGAEENLLKLGGIARQCHGRRSGTLAGYPRRIRASQQARR